MTTRSNRLLKFLVCVAILSTRVADAQTRVGRPRLRPSPTLSAFSFGARKPPNQQSRGQIQYHPDASDSSQEDVRPAELVMRARQALWHAQPVGSRKSRSPELGSWTGDTRRTSAEPYLDEEDYATSDQEQLLDSSEPAPGGWTTQLPYEPDVVSYSARDDMGDRENCYLHDPNAAMNSWQIDSNAGTYGSTTGDCIQTPCGGGYGPTCISIFSGVQGFTNPINEASGGSFGFHEGLNIGTPLPILAGNDWGWQIGLQATQSNIFGTRSSRRERHQTFFTTGVFRRVARGLQGGLVFDMLDDEWLDDVRLTQLRGEIGWKFASGRELGYWFAGSGASDQATQTLTEPIRFTVTDVQGFYCRQPVWNCPNSSVRLLVGFSNDSDGLIAADSLFPLTNRISLASSFAYLIPNESTDQGRAQNEAWNIGLSLRFALNGSSQTSRFAPLFSVADNGVFFVDAD